MAVILQPITISIADSSPAFTTDGNPILRPGLPTHEGCGIFTKTKMVSSKKGQCPVLEWVFLSVLGNAVDLNTVIDGVETSETSESSLSISSADAAVYTAKSRFSDCDFGGTVFETKGTFINLAAGIVQFPLPADFGNLGGIYQVEVAILRDDIPVLTNRLLWSVEEGMWGDMTKTSATPSLGEIRMHLRDTGVENSLLQDVEYDDEEIMHAIIRPVQYWNEVPPPIDVYKCRTFPFRYFWLEAICGELMRTAAHHYMRNNLSVDHGGVKGNFKNKYQEYLAYSAEYTQRWQQFVEVKKIEINAGLGFASLGSPYR